MNQLLGTVDALFRLGTGAMSEVVTETIKLQHSLPFRTGVSGSAIWPHKRSKGVDYARKRRFRGGRFKW